jgi:DNA (cytosine-5)-methyltransferase 1
MTYPHDRQKGDRHGRRERRPERRRRRGRGWVVSRPKLLDLFCGGGGAGMGYARAGFDVVGVDIAHQARYPFEFHQADALEYLAEHGRDFDAIHASPPCQAYSAMLRATRHTEKPRLIAETRAALRTIGKPYVIENVEGAGADLRDWVMLCGTMFGLRVRRHRLFELSLSLPILTPPCACRLGVVRGSLIGHRTHGRVAPGRTKPPHHTETELRAAMGVEWMTTQETREAIPPAFTEFIGAQVIGWIAPAWAACGDGCGDFWCNSHQMHAYDCPCPPIEEWEHDPYTACEASA